MTLAEFRILVDAPAKWVHNARAILGPCVRYTLAAAERLALARHLNLEFGISLPRAWTIAEDALADPSRAAPVELTGGGGLFTLTMDIQRLRAAIAARRSLIENQPAARRAGRKPARPTDPVGAAREHGLDVTLLEANLARRPLDRLRQLDGMMAFRSTVRRKGYRV